MQDQYGKPKKRAARLPRLAPPLCLFQVRCRDTRPLQTLHSFGVLSEVLGFVGGRAPARPGTGAARTLKSRAKLRRAAWTPKSSAFSEEPRGSYKFWDWRHAVSQTTSHAAPWGCKRERRPVCAASTTFISQRLMSKNTTPSTLWHHW